MLVLSSNVSERSIGRPNNCYGTLIGSPLWVTTTPSGWNLSCFERSSSGSFIFEALISQQLVALGHILLLNTNRELYILEVKPIWPVTFDNE